MTLTTWPQLVGLATPEKERRPPKSMLYGFQKDAVDFLTSRGRACLFLEMGLGKTPVSLIAARELDAATILIVCPTFAISTWEAEIEKWFPTLLTAVVSGERKQRESGWEAWGKLRTARRTPRALITTYRHLEEVAGAVKEWDLAIYDEAHLISNRKTIAFKAAKQIKSLWLAVLTGTPQRKTPAELWNYLHLIDKKRFSSYWRFVNENFLVDDGRYGKEILGLSNPAAFRALLAPYALRRLKADVLTELPALQRQSVFVEPDAAFRSAYSTLVEELMLEIGDGLLTVPNALTLTTRLRQLTVCPELLGLPLQSPVIPAAAEVAEPILRGGGKLVIFTPFRRAIPYLLEPFQQWPCFQIHGEQARTMNARQLETFQGIRGPAVLFATVSMAASWSANTASACLFVGFSFSPIEHQQAEGRLHRHGQQNAVNAYYIGAKGTIDESIAAVLSGKVALAELALNPRRLVTP